MRKKLCCLLFVFVMLLSITPATAMAYDEPTEAAETLYALGLFRGTGTNADGTPVFSLEQTPTREQAVIMLVRLLGKEEEALSGQWQLPFTDVTKGSAAYPYIGYAYANGLTNGTSAATYSGSRPIPANQYISFVLRALGYVSGEDFQVATAWEFSDKIGLTDGRYSAAAKAFTRGDVAMISANALEQPLVGTDRTLEAYIREQTAPAVTFPALLEEFTAEHRALVEGNGSFAGFEEYLVEDHAAAALLTDSEIAALLAKRSRTTTVTYAQAAADVDLLFRAFKSTYGAKTDALIS